MSACLRGVTLLVRGAERRGVSWCLPGGAGHRWTALRRDALFAELQLRQRTWSGPCGWPPSVTSVVWSAVRSVAWWGGRPQPGHQSPCRWRCASTVALRRALSRGSVAFDPNCRCRRPCSRRCCGQRDSSCNSGQPGTAQTFESGFGHQFRPARASAIACWRAASSS